MIVDRSKRWRDRRASFRLADVPFNPAGHAVDIVTDQVAAQFLGAHHYLGPALPPTRLCVGLFSPATGGSTKLIGLAALTVPMNQHVVPKYTGLTADRGAELGRFCCSDEVAHNGESWFASRAFRLLRQARPQIEAVVSYADPDASSPAGAAHTGQVYAGLSAALRGRSARRRRWRTAAGPVVSERALSKISGAETGSDYACRQLVALGAPIPDRPPAEWLDHLKAIGFVRPERSAGNYVYAFALTLAGRLAARGLPRCPYPNYTSLTEPLDAPLIPALAL